MTKNDLASILAEVIADAEAHQDYVSQEFSQKRIPKNKDEDLAAIVPMLAGLKGLANYLRRS